MEKSNGAIQKEHKLVRDKFLKGMRRSFKKLVKEASLRDDELVFVIDSKVKSVKARKIKI